jgi:hypothetical protein
MNYIVDLFGALLIVGGLILLIKPAYLVGLLQPYTEELALYVLAISVRLVFGAALVLVAEFSKFPVMLSALGYITLLAVVVLVAMGHARFKRLMAWALNHAMKYAWASGLFVLLLGIFIIYAVT